MDYINIMPLTAMLYGITYNTKIIIKLYSYIQIQLYKYIYNENIYTHKTIR